MTTTAATTTTDSANPVAGGREAQIVSRTYVSTHEWRASEIGAGGRLTYRDTIYADVMGSRIPAPTTADMTEAEVSIWRREMAILAADPRTADAANRPAWLVARVLREGREVSR